MTQSVMRLSELRAGDVMVGCMPGNTYLVLWKEPGDEAWLDLHCSKVIAMKGAEADMDRYIVTFAVIRDGVVIHESE